MLLGIITYLLAAGNIQPTYTNFTQDIDLQKMVEAVQIQPGDVGKLRLRSMDPKNAVNSEVKQTWSGENQERFLSNPKILVSPPIVSSLNTGLVIDFKSVEIERSFVDPTAKSENLIFEIKKEYFDPVAGEIEVLITYELSGKAVISKDPKYFAELQFLSSLSLISLNYSLVIR